MSTAFGQDGHRLRRLTRWSALGAVVVLGVAVLLVNHGRGPSTDPASSPATASADTLQGYAARLSGFESAPGFGAVVQDQTTDAVTVYWKGDPPQQLIQEVADAPAGIRATVDACDYSAEELAAAAERAWHTSVPETRGRLAEIEPVVDRSGLVVHVTGDEPVDEAAIAAIAGTPTHVEYRATKPQSLDYPAPDPKP